MKLSEAAYSIVTANSIVTFSGAGLSAESGIPTFRDKKDGFWSKFSSEQMSTPKGFISNPALVWKWYFDRHIAAKTVQPNPAHLALAEIHSFCETFHITQNVDGLLARAGCQNILELHGSINKFKCFDCGKPFLNEISDELLHCETCGGLIRPDIVWFGEKLNPNEFNQAVARTRECDVFIVIGTSGEVSPASEFPLFAKKRGAYVINVNPNRSAFDTIAHANFNEKAGIILPQIIELAKELQK